MNARLIASWLGENSMRLAGAPKIDRAGQTGGSATGYIGLPDLQLTAALTYRNGPWQMYLQSHFVDSGKLDATLRQGIDIDDNTVASAFYTDLRLSYSTDMTRAGSWEIYARVENLFDRNPPRAADFSDFNGATHTNETLFDVLGRRYTLGGAPPLLTGRPSEARRWPQGVQTHPRPVFVCAVEHKGEVYP